MASLRSRLGHYQNSLSKKFNYTDIHDSIVSFAELIQKRIYSINILFYLPLSLLLSAFLIVSRYMLNIRFSLNFAVVNHLLKLCSGTTACCQFLPLLDLLQYLHPLQGFLEHVLLCSHFLKIILKILRFPFLV